MKKILILIFVLILMMGVVSASPTLKTYVESDNITLKSVNFTVPSNWIENFSYSNSTFKQFYDGNNTLNISVVDGSLDDVEKVKSNKTVIEEMTTVGSVEGYYIAYNESCVFSYEEGNRLVTIKAPNLNIIFDVMGID